VGEKDERVSITQKIQRERYQEMKKNYLKRTRSDSKDDNSEDSVRGTKLKRKNVGKMH
jgi:hypothetical protein